MTAALQRNRRENRGGGGREEGLRKKLFIQLRSEKTQKGCKKRFKKRNREGVGRVQPDEGRTPKEERMRKKKKKKLEKLPKARRAPKVGITGGGQKNVCSKKPENI